jgi:mono/diheme cytochrome c family protein
MRAVIVRFVGALATAAVVSCNDGSSAPEVAPPAATFTEIYAVLYPTDTNARCNFCHGLAANDVSNGNLAMGTDKAAAYAALVGKSSASRACKGSLLVVAGHPESSFFLEKLSENPKCGSRMPLGGDLLTDEQREKVRGWIAAGAKDD